MADALAGVAGAELKEGFPRDLGAGQERRTPVDLGPHTGVAISTGVGPGVRPRLMCCLEAKGTRDAEVEAFEYLLAGPEIDGHGLAGYWLTPAC